MDEPPFTVCLAPDDERGLAPHALAWCKAFKSLLSLLGTTAEIKWSCFSFQHTNDVSGISRMIISAHFSGITSRIDINDIHFDDSDSTSGQAYVAELRAFAKRVLSSMQVSVCVCAFVKLPNACGRIQDYRNRLLENNIVDDPNVFGSVDLFGCPLCRSHLRYCHLCHHTVVCSNRNCAGRRVVDCVQCDRHDLMTCRKCLDAEDPDKVTSFVHCPTCNTWCCRHDVDWCPGRIIHPAPSTEELAELSQQWHVDSEMVVRAHPPRVAPCWSCTTSGHATRWQVCSGRRADLCPSHAGALSEFGLGGVYCPECTAEHNGKRCACGAVWLCDACPAADPDDPNDLDLISCPRCGAAYCREEEDGCQYCLFCQICRRFGLCVGCQDREKEDGGEEDVSEESSQLVSAVERCVECSVYMCTECCSTAQGGVVQCAACDHWMCGSCGDGRTLCLLCSWYA
ncbi:hypothetical protein V8E55_007463 [Tylopilus felleus]